MIKHNLSTSFRIIPYININSNVPTVSGSVTINASQGQIFVTISGSATSTIYSPQPYYISLTLPNGNMGILMNGTINFISPYNTPVLARPRPLVISSPDVTINISDSDDFVFWPPPLIPPVTSMVGSWTPAPNPIIWNGNANN